jgi:hypothetical protein
VFQRVVPEVWLSYRRRNRVAVIGLLLGFPITVAIAIVLKLFSGPPHEAGLVGLVIVWAALWSWSAFRLARWPCPQCGKAWLSGQEPRLGAIRCCANCGLGLYQVPGVQRES